MGCMVYGAVWLYAHTALYGAVCRCMAVWRQEGGGTGRGTCMERNTAKYSEIQPNSIQPAIQQTWAVCAYSRIPWRPPAVYGTPRNHTEKTGGGGLEPSAANPDYWDLVPYSENNRSISDPGCLPANVKAAHSSNFCATSRPSAPCLSTHERQRLRIARAIELPRKN